MLAWFVDKVLPALVVFMITTPVTLFLLNRQQTDALKDHVDDATDKQTTELKQALGKMHGTTTHHSGGRSD